jgi:hypothetical protein
MRHEGGRAQFRVIFGVELHSRALETRKFSFVQLFLSLAVVNAKKFCNQLLPLGETRVPRLV